MPNRERKQMSLFTFVFKNEFDSINFNEMDTILASFFFFRFRTIHLIFFFVWIQKRTHCEMIKHKCKFKTNLYKEETKNESIIQNQ